MKAYYHANNRIVTEILPVPANLAVSE